MAKQPREPGQLIEDELVQRLVPQAEGEAARAPGGCLRSGWVGPSPRKGYSRLYISSLDMNEWLEFRTQDVMHQQKLSSEQTLQSGSILWFKPDTKLAYGRNGPPIELHGFLDGDIKRKFMGDTVLANPTQAFFSTIPCTIVISLAACTFFETCSHGECKPPDK